MILSGVFFRKQDTAGRKSLFMPVNRSVLDVAQKRKDWNGLISGLRQVTLCFWMKADANGYDKAVCLFAWRKQSC